MTKPYKCRVEYLESTGTQYIDTGLKGKNNIDFDYKCIFTNLDGTAQCVGGNWSGAGTSTVSLYLGLIRTNGNFAYHYDGTQSPVVVMNTTVQGTPYSIQGRMWVDEQYMVINGTKSSVGTISSTFTSSLNMYLFGINNNGLSNPAYMKLYYCKIYDNGTLVRDYIPVLDNSGRPAMYDQVSGQLFYNQGSGEFTYGRQIIPVEYLESTGTQYIDTGYAFTDNFTWEIDFNGISDGCTLFGGRTSSTRTALLYQRNYGGIDKTTCPIAGYNGQETPFQLEDLRVGRHKIKMSVASNKGSVWVDGTQFYNEQTFTGSYISEITQALFADKFGTNDYREQTSSKVYGLKMWQGSTLVRDFLPCIDENLIPFMFDKVHNTVYLNAGTGQFKVGPNVEKMWGSKRIRKKLALLLANLKKKRPYYCEVEYLESTGTQYIDTGWSPVSNDLRVNFRTKSMSSPAATAVCGAEKIGATPRWVFILYGQNTDTTKTFPLTGDWNNNSNGFTFTSGSVLEIDWTTSSTSTTITDNVSGTTYTKTFGSAINYSNNNITLKLFQNGNNQKSSIQINYYKIWDNGVLVRDLIPVLDWSYIPCMYDKVSGQFFYNAGTGDFIYGREIHYVDYLEADGTQYINTGVYLTNNHSVEIDYQLTVASQNRKGIYGGLVANGARHGALLSPSNNYLEFGYGSSNVWYQLGLPDTKRHIMYQKKNELYFDGVLIYTFNTATFTQNFSSPLGNFNYTNYNPASAKYYASRWLDGNTIIRNYKPAIDENGVGFMFDKVTHTIFDNAGTGVFKYPARETEYIEVTDLGTNNQNPCIDLGLKYKSSMSIESKYTRTGMGVSGSVLPLSNSTTQPLIYMPALNASVKTDRFVWRRPSLPEASYYYNFADYPMTVEFKVDAVNDTLTVNGNVAKTGMIASMNGYTSPYQSDSNLYMLSINGTYGGMGKVYYVKIYDATQVYRDLIPVWKDGVACIYDKQNNVYYSNTKTGTVICGKIVEPEYE